MAVEGFLRNVLYSPWRLVHRHLNAYSRYEYSLKKWRNPRTGRFISQRKALRIRRSVAYWNRVRSVVRAHETWTYLNARTALKDYKVNYSAMSPEEKHEAQTEMWGYWVGG